MVKVPTSAFQVRMRRSPPLDSSLPAAITSPPTASIITACAAATAPNPWCRIIQDSGAPPSAIPRYLPANMMLCTAPRSLSGTMSTAQASTAMSCSAANPLCARRSAMKVARPSTGSVPMSPISVAPMPSWPRRIHGRRRPKRPIATRSMIGATIHFRLQGRSTAATSDEIDPWPTRLAR
jgi:hypothetical protein